MSYSLASMNMLDDSGQDVDYLVFLNFEWIDLCMQG